MLRLQSLSSWILPLLLLTAAWFSLESIDAIDANYQPLLPYAPYIILCLALGLAWQFNRARSFAIGIIIGTVYFAVQQFLQRPLSEQTAHFIYTSISLLAPANLLLALLLPERGLRHFSGLLLIGLVPVEVVGLWISYHLYPNDILGLLTHFPIKPATDYILSIHASLWFALATLLSGGWIAWRKVEAGASLLFALLALFCVLAWLQKPYISVVMVSAAGIMLMADLLKNSYDMAYRDELTGILGRRALNEKLRGLGKRYVVAMLDIDHFKKFNDTHGHDVGDDVLKLVAKKVEAVSGGGKAYRYGGEEFTIVFPGKKIEHCLAHLEAIRETIANYPLVIRNQAERPKDKQQGSTQRGQKGRHKTTSVTASIGVAERSESLKTPEQVIKAADKALYKAKKQGRNRVV